MFKFKSIKEGIRNLKIQGAQNVAEYGILSLGLPRSSIKQLLKLRPTEPMLRNLVRIVKNKPKDKGPWVIGYLDAAEELIKGYGQSVLKKNIYTHCHSSTVVTILLASKRKLNIYNTETRPRYQGRKTVEELHFRHNIDYFIDSGMYHALRKAEVVLLGIDGVTDKTFVNKIGSYAVVCLAKELKIPVYVAGTLLKYDYDKKMKIEFRNYQKVWDKRLKNLDILNPSFDEVPFKFINGFITEEGIIEPKEFPKRARRRIKQLMLLDSF